MGAFGYNDNGIDGDVYIQRLAVYIKRHEEALANGLLFYSKNRPHANMKSLRLTLTIHHLYYLCERIDSSNLGVDVGPLNIKLDNPNHEPTFISFLANNARSSKHFDSDTRSISSINSMRSIMSTASVYWRTLSFSRDPKVIYKDLRYIYSSFTKIPCLVLSPQTKINNISGYEEYPCDTSVPIKMFKNLQVLEIIEYEPNGIYGWHTLSDQLRILIIRGSKVNNIAEILFNLVIDDESGRSSFNFHKPLKKLIGDDQNHVFTDYDNSNTIESYPQQLSTGNPTFMRRRATTSGAGSVSKGFATSESHLSRMHAHDEFCSKDYKSLAEGKWTMLKQLTVSETSVISIDSFVFKPLFNLVKLNISSNLLEALPEGLDQLQSLRYLNVADNYITDLRNLPTNLKHLISINFNNNKIKNLEGLENLKALQKIDFRRNDLSSIEELKPLVRLFIKCPDRLSSVYLSSNKLPKSYRIDLFNLFNGVKYKNSVKIDDSRPGYFESAALLDGESSARELIRFLGINDLANKLAPIKRDLSMNLAESLSELHVLNRPDDTENAMKSKSESVRPRLTAQVLTHDDGSTSEFQSPVSPLLPNQRITNQSNLSDSFIKSNAYPTISMSSSASTILPQAQKRPLSTTLQLLDAPASNSAAPGVITPVQVTARMSS